MEFGTTVLGVAVGALVGFAKGGKTLNYALWGGGIGLGASLLGVRAHGGFSVGDLPFSLPDAAQPGQLVYNVDPRRDPLLDPVSRERLYPDWLLLHWQNGDPTIIAQLQHALGVPADGVRGGATMTALHAFQARVGLPATGSMDRATMQALILG
jgi:peptidoglycan hydrolase-like protein with peptidoglycan-binding domain